MVTAGSKEPRGAEQPEEGGGEEDEGEAKTEAAN